MTDLLEILNDIRPDIDYENCEDLVDGKHLDSLSIIALIAELEDVFDVTIPAVEIIPDNFNSVGRIFAMLQRLQEEY
ncbi:MAG: acyl carrier protein [Clostridia bacterium]|nr:acyl carrier protein [Clostridia bacterium]